MKQLLPILLLTLVLSCGHKEHKKKLDHDQVESEIKQMLSEYHLAIRKEGLTGEFFYLDSSDDFFWVPPGYNSALDYDSVHTILENNSKAFSNIQFDWDQLKIFPLSDELANYTGIVKGQMTDTSDNTVHVSIIESGTIIKRESGWKLLSGQSAVLDQ